MAKVFIPTFTIDNVLMGGEWHQKRDKLAQRFVL